MEFFHSKIFTSGDKFQWFWPCYQGHDTEKLSEHFSRRSLFVKKLLMKKNLKSFWNISCGTVQYYIDLISRGKL